VAAARGGAAVLGWAARELGCGIGPRIERTRTGSRAKREGGEKEKQRLFFFY